MPHFLTAEKDKIFHFKVAESFSQVISLAERYTVSTLYVAMRT
jgi:hypothetical protein